MSFMEERFFTSKQAAQIAGCTLRQLQYWRESGVVVPAIAETGTGRSIYYSEEIWWSWRRWFIGCRWVLRLRWRGKC
jgi:hypothetical protein